MDTLGGEIASFGLVLDGIGFALALIFVLVTSVILLRRDDTVPPNGTVLNPSPNGRPTLQFGACEAGRRVNERAQ